MLLLFRARIGGGVGGSSRFGDARAFEPAVWDLEVTEIPKVVHGVQGVEFELIEIRR